MKDLIVFLLGFHPKDFIPFRVEPILINHYNTHFSNNMGLHSLPYLALSYLAQALRIDDYHNYPLRGLDVLIGHIFGWPYFVIICNGPL